MSLNYNGTIYRPPVEANTLLLPVTEGCTHNKCRFCNMYKDIPFRKLKDEEICAWLSDVRTSYGYFADRIERIYLVGGDPFALSAKKLEEVIVRIHEYLPRVATITMYAAIRNIKSKSDAELVRLHELGVDDLYVGVECGLDSVLTYLNKGQTVQDIREQCGRLNSLGIKHRDLLMIGTAGAGHAKESALAIAELENELKPTMMLLTTMSAFEGSELSKDIAANRFTPCGETEILTEEKIVLENLNLPNCYFWAAHSLDSVRIQGYLGESQQEMIATLEDGINHMDDALFAQTFRREQL